MMALLGVVIRRTWGTTPHLKCCLFLQTSVTGPPTGSDSPVTARAARSDSTPQPPPATVTTTTTTPSQPNMSYASQLSSGIVVSE